MIEIIDPELLQVNFEPIKYRESEFDGFTKINLVTYMLMAYFFLLKESRLQGCPGVILLLLCVLMEGRKNYHSSPFLTVKTSKKCGKWQMVVAPNREGRDDLWGQKTREMKKLEGK